MDAPLEKLLDLLGRRWALRIVWELRDDAPSFRELQRRCSAISSSVLAQRLVDLRDGGIVTPAEGGGYRLTSEGRVLLEGLSPIETWARFWDRSGSPGSG